MEYLIVSIIALLAIAFWAIARRGRNQRREEEAAAITAAVSRPARSDPVVHQDEATSADTGESPPQRADHSADEPPGEAEKVQQINMRCVIGKMSARELADDSLDDETR